MTLSRRTLLLSAPAFLAAPALVRAGNIMPVRVVDFPAVSEPVPELMDLMHKVWLDMMVNGTGMMRVTPEGYRHVPISDVC